MNNIQYHMGESKRVAHKGVYDAGRVALHPRDYNIASSIILALLSPTIHLISSPVLRVMKVVSYD